MIDPNLSANARSVRTTIPERPPPTPRLEDRPETRHSESEPDSAEKLLKYMADEAMSYPPKDIHVLSASISKFLLTNLEPALRMAREIREQAMSADSQAMVALEMSAGDRREATLTLLTGE